MNTQVASTYAHFLLASNLWQFGVVTWSLQEAARKSRSHSPQCLVFCPSLQMVGEVAASESFQVGLGSL